MFNDSTLNSFEISDPDPFWLKRWLSVSQAIDETIANLPDDLHDPFKTLLEKLKEFGEKQFFYFFCGFSHKKWIANQFSQDDFLDSMTDNAKNVTIENGVFSSETEDQQSMSSTEAQEEAQDRRNAILALLGTINTQKLIKDYTNPPDYVLRATLDQISYDYELIQRAIHQRLKGTADEIQTLKDADQFGELLLERSYFQKLLQPIPKVVCYINKSPQIRMIPYDNVALIGIPSTSNLPNARHDLLVLPHELGHYVYWHGQHNGTSIRTLLKSLVQKEYPFMKAWVEELFADVFAMIWAKQNQHEDLKELMVSWVFDMLLDNPPTNYWQDNRTHPIDAIRALLYLEELIPNSAEGDESSEMVKKRAKFERKQALFELMSGGIQHFQTVNRYGKPIEISHEHLTSMVKDVIKLIIKTIWPEQAHIFHSLFDLQSAYKKLISTLEAVYGKPFYFHHDNISIRLSSVNDKIKPAIEELLSRSSFTINIYQRNDDILFSMEELTNPNSIDVQYLDLGKSYTRQGKSLPTTNFLSIVEDMYHRSFYFYDVEAGGRNSKVYRLYEKILELTNELRLQILRPARPFRPIEINYNQLWAYQMEGNIIFTEQELSEQSKGILIEQIKELQSHQDLPKRSFEILRDAQFPTAIKPEIWRIIFAADGWTIRGPETRPTGVWEGRHEQVHSGFHS